MNSKHYRPVDLELEQCHIRLGVALPFLLLWFGFWFERVETEDARVGLLILSVFSAYAVVLWLHVRRFPGNNRLRRIIAIATDQAGCFAGMLVPGVMGGVVIFLPLWISLGNGIRFGVKWMAWSVTLALLGVAGLGVFSDYWSQHPSWLVGLALLNIAIPLYMATLIGGFQENRRNLSLYADAMKALALKDTLTGLCNRGAFFEALDRASAHAQRTRTVLAVLFFDLNGFKKVNDAFGHATGDRLLREVASAVQAELRSEDVLARLGGDEFVALLQFDQHPPERAAERILRALGDIREIDGHPLAVSASVGIVVVNGADAVALGAERLVELADLNMYAAKRAGRGQVVVTHHDLQTSALAGV